ncbi:MAG: hypothetical protein IIB83_00495 [Bacteroidetes bacterium]|nr:hypothetical protein [Bacteroidota bacterium]
MLIESELNKALKNISKYETTQQRRTSQTKYGEGEINKKLKDDVTSDLQTEKELIKLLFESNIEITKYILGNLNVDDFLNERHKVIVSKISDKFSADEVIDPSLIMDVFKDESIELYLRELLFDKYSISPKWEELMPESENEYKLFNYAVEVVNKMKINILNKLIKQNLIELELAENEDEEYKLNKLGRELTNERSVLLKK